MAPLWDPRLTLRLQDEGQAEWTCAATVTPSVGDNNTATPRRCDRKIRPSELNKIRKLLADISHQEPDQIDFNVLLHLARACLCIEKPSPHQGNQEASVIYEWTGLMSLEAARLRATAESAKHTAVAGEEPADAADKSLSAKDDGSNKWDTATSIASSPVFSASTTPEDTRPPPTAFKSMATNLAQRRERRTAEASSQVTPKILLLPSTPRFSSASTGATLPPSPPDSSTFALSSSPASSAPAPAPTPATVALQQQPTPLSFAALASANSTDSSATVLLEPPLPTGTTIDTDDSTNLSTPLPQASFPRDVAGAVPPPLPTSTTTITFSSSCASSSEDPAGNGGQHDGHPRHGAMLLRPLPSMRLAPRQPRHGGPGLAAAKGGTGMGDATGSGASAAGGAAATATTASVGAVVLGELEEYNRLLQETQSRHETLLAQTAQLRRELATLRREQRGGGAGGGAVVAAHATATATAGSSSDTAATANLPSVSAPAQGIAMAPLPPTMDRLGQQHAHAHGHNIVMANPHPQVRPITLSLLGAYLFAWIAATWAEGGQCLLRALRDNGTGGAVSAQLLSWCSSRLLLFVSSVVGFVELVLAKGMSPVSRALARRVRKRVGLGAEKMV